MSLDPFAREVVRDTEDELVDVLGRIAELDRTRCRKEAERRFSPAAMAAAYERVYERLVARDTPAATRLRLSGADGFAKRRQWLVS